MEIVQTKRSIYRKAYTELNEIFNSALSFEVEKIPSNVLENMRKILKISWQIGFCVL